MNRAEVIATIALFISVLSTGFSIYAIVRDRQRVKAKAVFFASGPNYEPEDPHVLVRIVNRGRRPVVLRAWHGSSDKGEIAGSPLGEGGGLHLKEAEFQEVTIKYRDTIFFPPDAYSAFEITRLLYIEDSVGRRWPIRGGKRALRRLHQATAEPTDQEDK